MGKEIVHTKKAPAAVGAYSQAVVAGEFMFTAGQIGLDPDSGLLVGEGVEKQAERSLENLSAILEAADVSFSDVVKTTIYLADIEDFSVVNALYEERFGGEKPPARSTVAVAELPMGARVEIDMIAYVGESKIPK